MNKVLLVQSYLGVNDEVGPVFPIGLAYIATAIEQIRWEIKVLDMNIYENPYEKLKQVIETFKPDVVGLSLRNIDNVDYDEFNYFYLELRKLTKIIKTNGCILFIGGAGYSIFAHQIFEKNRDIDFGVVLEGEETVVELLNAMQNNKEFSTIKGLFYRENNKTVFTGYRKPIDFAKSKIPNKKYFELDKYFRPICLGVQSKRGCPLKCSYCIYPFLNKNTLRIRPANSVVDEIEELVNVYGAKEFIFCDDIFNAPRGPALEIIKEMLRRGIFVRWSAWFDAGNADEEFLDLAIKSGCYRISFSFDGVVNKTLRVLNKNFDEKQIDNVIRLCNKTKYKKIKFRFSLFALPPEQTIYGIFRTLKIIYQTSVKMLNGKCLVSWIRILPNTNIYNQYCEKDVDLLPEEINSKNKAGLFYIDKKYPRVFISIYRMLIFGIFLLRKIRKK